MSRWWRAYDEAVDDPKLLLLSDRQHRAWFNLMCIASVYDGTLPDIKVIAVKLRMSQPKAEAICRELRDAGLLDVTETGVTPHNWNARQFKSDVSTDRVKRFRNGQRNVSETPPDNRVQRTETEKKEKVFRTVAVATRPDRDESFEEFWKAYPKRKGGNPKSPAKKLFDAAVGQGAEASSITAALRSGVGFDREKVGTEYIPQAVKWLRDRRWEDWTPPTAPGERAPVGWRPGMPTHEELLSKYREKPNEHNDIPATAASVEGRSDHGEELLSEVTGVHRGAPNGGSGFAPGDQPRQRGMAPVGAVLRRSLGVAAGGFEARENGSDEGWDDGPDPVAAVVR